VEVLASSDRLQVGVTRAFRPEALAVVVWVHNAGTALLGNVRILPSAVPFLKSAVVPGSTGASAPGGTHGVLATLAPGASAAVVVKFTISNVPAPTSAAFRVLADGLPGPVDAVMPLPTHLLLRPAELDTPAFGSKWTSPTFAAAASLVISPGATQGSWTLDRFAAQLPRLRLHAIESIARTSEAIAAAQLMGTQQFALVHAKVAPAEVRLTVKSANQAFSNAVAASLKDALA
jgi:hypothetical protein